MSRSVKSNVRIPIFLTADGEMGKLIRSIDWSQTPIGDPDQWPQSLRASVSIMLNNPFGMFIAWGNEFTLLYNDAYRSVLGTTKHPDALGNSVCYSFKEIWHIIGPVFDEVMQGKPVGFQDCLLPLDRNGYVEECYFDFSYVPIFLDSGQIGGILATVIETTKKINAFKKLEESKQQLQFAIEDAELAIWDYYPLTNTFTANKRYEDWFGIQADERSNNNLAIAAIAEKDRQRVLKTLSRSLDYSSGGRFNIEYTSQPPFRKKRILRAKGKAWFNEEKIAYRLNGTLQDITEEVYSRRSLIQNENNLRNIVLQSPVAMCVLKGPEFLVEIANGAMVELWSTSMENVINKPLFVGRPEVKGQGLEELLQRVYNTGERFSAYERPVNLPRHGQMKLAYINFVYEAFREGDGNISGIMAVATDVTAQVLARKKIEESEQRFRTLAETLPQLIWMTDQNGGQQYASSRWEDYTGIKPSGAETWKQIVHPADMQKISDAWNNSLALGKVYSAEVRLKSKEGSYRWHFVQGEPIFDEEGKIIKWIGAFTDVHDQKTLTEKLESLVHERTAELQRSNDDLQQFAHVASHDLKEPLRKIKTYTNRVEDDRESVLSEKGRTYLTKVQNASDRLFSMIDGVLKYSMVDAHEQPVETVDLNKIVESIENDLEVIIQKQAAIFQYRKLNVIEGSSVLIYQLFYNLINNSLKFAKPGEQLKICVESIPIEENGNTFIETSIKDNGIGFDQEQAERIFNTFTRLHSKDKYEGTGLGLALCKKIVERHHGSIRAKGCKDVGAEFILLLPEKQTSNHI
jgi:PAS domain S-box-containing protein